MMMALLPGMEDTTRALSRTESLAFLRGERFGRVAFSSEGLLTIVPVPFALERGRVVIGADRPQLMDQSVGQVVTIQCDGYDERAGEQWSVCATGFVARDRSGELFIEPRLFSGWAERRSRSSSPGPILAGGVPAS